MIRPILPIQPILPNMPEPSAAVYEGFIAAGKCALVLGFALLCVWLMLMIQKRNGITPSKALCLLLTASVGLVFFIPSGMTLEAAKGLLLFGILLYASLSDIYKREVPDCVWVMIAILALVGFDSANLASMLIGAAVVFIPQFALAMIRPNRAVGGADIKISTASAFLLGAEKGILALIVGLTAAVICILIIRKVKKTDKTEAFPLVPFLSIGIMTAFIL